MHMIEPDTSNAVRPPSELSAVVIPLLKGILYRDENLALWNLLVQVQIDVRKYVSVLGLELMVDEAEGYAYLHSRKDTDEEEAASVPRLIPRRQLSYPVSLLLALLRKKLAEHNALGGDTRLILSLEEVVELVRIFLPPDGNEAKMMDKVDASLTKIGDMGFIRRLRGQNQMIEVRRIIKAFVDAQWLAGFRLQRLELFNWGTFDGRVWTLRPNGKTSLLTGDIGSGKSTLVDAVTTLLVPSNRIAYNKAAGAENRERTLRSYVLGYFKSERQENFGNARPVALRDMNACSVLQSAIAEKGGDRIERLAAAIQTSRLELERRQQKYARYEKLEQCRKNCGTGKRGPAPARTYGQDGQHRQYPAKTANRYQKPTFNPFKAR